MMAVIAWLFWQTDWVVDHKVTADEFLGLGLALIQIMLATLGLGLAVVAILGYQGLQNVAREKAGEIANRIVNDRISTVKDVDAAIMPSPAEERGQSKQERREPDVESRAV